MLRQIVIKCGKDSMKISWMMIKIFIPLSILTFILKQTGVIDFISPVFAPVMELMGLPGETAITLIASATNGIYGGVATMASFDLSFRQITILGIVLGFAHNLIVETGILMKLKFATLRIAFFRFAMGIIAGIVLNQILPADVHGVVLNPYAKVTEFSWAKAFMSMGTTSLQIILLTLVLSISYELLRLWKFAQKIKLKMSSVSGSMGIAEKSFVPWVVGYIFGIVYGAAILFKFAEKKEISHKDASLITVFICMAHAIIEDTMLFVVIGGNAWWIFLVRTVLALLLMKILSINNWYKKVMWIGLARE